MYPGAIARQTLGHDFMPSLVLLLFILMANLNADCPSEPSGQERIELFYHVTVDSDDPGLMVSVEDTSAAARSSGVRGRREDAAG